MKSQSNFYCQSDLIEVKLFYNYIFQGTKKRKEIKIWMILKFLKNVIPELQQSRPRRLRVQTIL